MIKYLVRIREQVHPTSEKEGAFKVLQLACGITVEPGMTRDDLLALPIVREAIRKTAHEQSIATYEGKLDQGHEEAYWLAADDYCCSMMELESLVVHRVRSCLVRRGERELSERVSREIMDLIWQQMEHGELMMFGDDEEERPDYIWLPGNEPHYAADCQDCHHPKPSHCSACNMLD